MGNVYILGRCPECNEIIDTTEMNTLMVHGSRSYDITLDMLQKGLSMKEIKSKFCGNCGEYIPCGCSNENPQA